MMLGSLVLLTLFHVHAEDMLIHEGLVYRAEKTYTGTYRYGPEASFFIPCHAGEEWWAEPLDDAVRAKMKLNESSHGDASSETYAITFRGRLIASVPDATHFTGEFNPGQRGGFGHNAASEKQVLVMDVLSSKPTDNDQHCEAP
ncbi:MAG: hypothetical protein HRU11_15325 [Parvularculaceae bacterium]|nr:hypothetical protein [Parvularculaceae bacterium]